MSCVSGNEPLPTKTLIVPVIAPDFAEIVAMPAATPNTKPLLLTEAAELLELQVTVVLKSAPFASLDRALS